MKIFHTELKYCAQADDLVVVIDVLRAFTTAAYFFNAGVEEIILVSGVEEAVKLRSALPGSLVSGEIDGIKVAGFDLGNSPSDIQNHDLRAKKIIQRTTAGTQGVVRSIHARTILTAALTNLSATVRYIQKAAPQTVTLVETGSYPESGIGDEDTACADLIESLLLGQAVDWSAIPGRIRSSKNGLKFNGVSSDFPASDLDMVLQIDLFDFAMLVEKKEGLLLYASHSGLVSRINLSKHRAVLLPPAG